MSRISAWRVLVWFVCAGAFAQQSLQVENAASLLTGDIAEGSLVKLQLIIQSGPVTPIDPATVSAQLLPVGFHDPLPLPILEIPDALSVLALIPRGAPLGPAGITLNYNGRASAAQNVNIVATSFGLYSAGFGETALAQNVTSTGSQLNNLTHPARPGDFVTLWGTGLGTATAGNVAVLLGGHPFPAAYAGPSADFTGLDQINFQVPDDTSIPQGCYVAVNVQIGNSISNLATLSLSLDAGPCRHPFGLTADELAQLDSGEEVYVGKIDLNSTIGPPASSAVSPINGYVRIETANALFSSYRASSLSVITGPIFADDYLGACTLTTGASGFLLDISELNVGNQLTVWGPGDKKLDLLPDPEYNGSVPVRPAVNSPDQLAAPFFSAGQWQASASGSSNVQPFTAMLSIPNPIQITNYDQVTMIDHTKDLTITWEPTTYSDADFVNVQLYGQLPTPFFGRSESVFCRVPAIAGQATVPAAMLASFQPVTGIAIALARPEARHRNDVHSPTKRWQLDRGCFPISFRRMDFRAVSLKDNLQSQLDRAWSAGPEHGIRAGHVRCFSPKAEWIVCRRIRKGVVAAWSSKRIGDVGVVENVEELSAELCLEALPPSPGFRD